MQIPKLKAASQRGSEPAIVSEFNVKKTLLGKYIVSYACPHCAAQLRSSESELGQEYDTCPECRMPFSVTSDASEEMEAVRLAAREAKRNKRNEKRLAEEQRKLRLEEEILRHSQPLMQAEKSERERRRQLVESYESESVSEPRTRPCPFCRETILEGAIKCKHCGSNLDAAEKDDALAGCLGLLLGPVGLWYKGHWAAGFAWLVMTMIFAISSAGLLLIPCWIGMAIHAASAKPRG
ncbi:MAG: hypothetical protein KDA52_07645 [Planctomycetaceae bacterium]|nr:hypothetical protein [Planctomycetaceae bacterium]